MKVDVFHDAFRIGALDVDGTGRVGFDYDPRWQRTRGAFAISLTMPLTVDRHPPDVTEPWIANLLPEEGPLRALSHALGVDRGDVISILRIIGGDTAGALSFGAPSVREAWRYEPLDTFYGMEGQEPGAVLARHFEDLAQRPFLAGEDGVRLSLAGGQEKTALAVVDEKGRARLGLPRPGDRLAIPHDGAPSTLIVKPDNPRLQGIVENEAYCLHLAAAVGLPVAQAGTLAAGGRAALAVVRYDRALRPDGSLRRLHQEDLAQANGVFPGQKYERGIPQGPTLAQILQVGRQLDPRSALGLLDQVIFNLLVANTDAHAKNYSVLLDPAPRLAPLYDVSSVLPWAHVNQYAAQNIGGRKRRPGDLHPRHWEGIAAEAGFNPRATRLRVEQLADAVFRARAGAEAAVAALPGVTAALLADAAERIEGNVLRILGRLTSA